jgi:hypothetical protein
MTRSDYEMIANVVRQHLDATWNTDPSRAMGIETLAMDLATQFAIDNDRFDKARFFKACNIEVAAP